MTVIWAEKKGKVSKCNKCIKLKQLCGMKDMIGDSKRSYDVKIRKLSYIKSMCEWHRSCLGLHTDFSKPHIDINISMRNNHGRLWWPCSSCLYLPSIKEALSTGLLVYEDGIFYQIIGLVPVSRRMFGNLKFPPKTLTFLLTSHIWLS